MASMLVTGATGFIGSHVVQTLQASGIHQVFPLPKGTDLTSNDATRAAFVAPGPVDYILHAADVGGDATWASRHPATQLLANSSMALNVIECWRDLQPQARLIGLSSLWAYPESVTTATESAYWDGRMHIPTEHYGLTKKLLGVGINAMRREHGLKGTMLVLGSVYGPGDTSTRVIPSLITRMRANPATLEVYGESSASRDFVYVDDQVAGILQHLDYEGELLNVTSGHYSTIGEVVSLLSEILRFTGKVVFSGSKGQGVAVRRVDISQAMAATGWPSNHRLHSLEEGLRKTIRSGVGIPRSC